MPAVPWTSKVESPDTAAARCSESQDLAVPGTPTSMSARSVASVATAISTSRAAPTYLGDTCEPSDNVPPSTYVRTAHGDKRHPGGRGPVSTAASRASSSA